MNLHPRVALESQYTPQTALVDGIEAAAPYPSTITTTCGVGFCGFSVTASTRTAEAAERARTTGKNAIPPDSSKQTRTTASRLLEGRKLTHTNQVQFESTFMFSLG